MATALIISTRAEVRRTLESFLKELPRFQNSQSFSSLSEAQNAAFREGIPDFVFISNEIDFEGVTAFIRNLKMLKFGKRTTFISVLKFGNAETEKIAECLAAGMHGMLNEPISMGGLEEVLELSKAVRHQGSKVRLKTAAALMLAGAVDRLTSDEGIPSDKKDLLTMVKDACRDYKRLTGFSISMEAVVSENGKGQGYSGVSKRVREIYELRLKSLIGKLFEQKPGSSSELPSVD